MSNSTTPAILLVDDEKHILFSYNLILKSAGIEHVLTMRDSRKVMPLLGKKNIAVIVLDLIMPHLSGMELLELTPVSTIRMLERRAAYLRDSITSSLPMRDRKT